jgi:tetratricopeptide (TPR) repeat protein
MPSRPEDDDRPGRRSGGGGARRPSGQGRPRSDRARKAGDDRKPRPSNRSRSDGASAGGARRSGADRDRGPRRDDRDGERPERGPRPPIKGKRRTFDVDSAPNARERARPAEGEQPRSERWVDEGPVRKAAGDAVERGSRRSGPPARRAGGRGRDDAPKKSTGGRSSQRRAERATKRVEGALEIDRDRLRRRLGQARADRTLGRIGEATAAYAEDRFEDARKAMKPIAELIPEEPAVRELYGLSLYRLGKWRQAIDELEEFARRSGSTEQHPVLADCYRALGQHDRVQELWDEIGEASLAAPLVAEGRIVYAGSLADRGMVVEAISVLEAGALGDKTLKDHHLRMRYVLGDLYDRAGEQQSARRWFESVASASPGFFDVQDRLRQL